MGTPNPTPQPTLPPDLEYTCPPDVVYSYSEASYYCKQSSLATVGTGDKYLCYWESIEVCKGIIDSSARRNACSAPVASCDTNDMRKVCDYNSTSFIQKQCDEQTSMTFECFDKTLYQYCVGQVRDGNMILTNSLQVFPITTGVAIEITKTIAVCAQSRSFQ